MSLVENITAIIPQRSPFVMIDELLYANETIARTAFQVSESNVLIDHGKFSEAGIIENIAQTAAAHAGFIALKNGGEVRTGYIGAIKSLHISLLPNISDSLITEIKMINQIFNVSIVEGKVFCNDKLIATCEMKIFLQEIAS